MTAVRAPVNPVIDCERDQDAGHDAVDDITEARTTSESVTAKTRPARPSIATASM
jgi:hypothetical protein